jgi:hypothetical protein
LNDVFAVARFTRAWKPRWRVGMLFAVLALAACSATNPDPSPFYDGRYAGTRVSNDTEICGAQTLKGSATAQVTKGRLTMSLFGPKTELDGTVGDNGRVRASGIWRTATESFPQITVLNGSIRDDTLDGTASNYRCETSVRLHKTAIEPRAPSRAAPTATKNRRRPSHE